MTDPNDPTQVALTVGCPFCEAQPGRPCTTTVGVRTGRPLVVADILRSHLERRQTAGLPR